MATYKKISGLPDADLPLNDADLFELLQGGVNKKAPKSAIAGGGGTWGSITGTLSNQTDLQTALNAKQALVNAATALVDGATIDLTAIKHTLTTSSSRTFTISYTGDNITLEVTLNATTSTFTFPATALCRSDGAATGDNTLPLNGASGDKYIIAIKKIGSAYYVASANFESQSIISNPPSRSSQILKVNPVASEKSHGS